jgi:hypothetical protein
LAKANNASNPHGNRQMPSRKYDVYKPAKPYFDLVRGVLG